MVPEPMTGKRQRAAFVLVTIFIDAIGFGLIMPVLPRLLMQVGGMPLSATIDLAGWIG